MVPQCGHGQGHWTLGSAPSLARENEFRILSHLPQPTPGNPLLAFASLSQVQVKALSAPAPTPLAQPAPKQSTGYGPKPRLATRYTPSVERLMQLGVRSHFC